MVNKNLQCKIKIADNDEEKGTLLTKEGLSYQLEHGTMMEHQVKAVHFLDNLCCIPTVTKHEQ